MAAALLLICTSASVARAAELKVATWDLGWLTQRDAGDSELPPGIGPKRPEDLALLSRYAEALAADVVALQGVDGADAAAAVFPASRYTLHLTADPVLQRTGFAVRRGLAVAVQPDVTALDPYKNARLHLRSGADIALALPGGATLRMLSVHLKSGCRDGPLDAPDRPDCATLRRQGQALHEWISARDKAGEPFIVLGDFARIMDGPDGFLPSVSEGILLMRVTERQATPCWDGGNFVDNLLTGGAARGWVQPGSLRVMVYREKGAAWRQRLSGHCPVSVRIRTPD